MGRRAASSRSPTAEAVSRDVFFDDEAEAEYSAAASWYEERRERLGKEFLDAVDATLHRIAYLPQTGSHVPRTDPELAIKRMPVKRFPYHVVYLALPRGIKVLAIAHDRQRPGYWKNRL